MNKNTPQGYTCFVPCLFLLFEILTSSSSSDEFVGSHIHPSLHQFLRNMMWRTIPRQLAFHPFVPPSTPELLVRRLSSPPTPHPDQRDSFDREPLALLALPF